MRLFSRFLRLCSCEPSQPFTPCFFDVCNQKICWFDIALSRDEIKILDIYQNLRYFNAKFRFVYLFRSLAVSKICTRNRFESVACLQHKLLNQRKIELVHCQKARQVESAQFAHNHQIVAPVYLLPVVAENGKNVFLPKSYLMQRF